MVKKMNKVVKCAVTFILALSMLLTPGFIYGIGSIIASAQSIDSRIEIVDSVPSTVIVEDIRIQLLSDTLVRIEAKNDNGFEDRETLIVQNRLDWEKVDFDAVEKTDKTVISTNSFSIHIPLGATSPDDVKIYDHSGKDTIIRPLPKQWSPSTTITLN